MTSKKNEGTMSIDIYFPPVAGALCFLKKLKVRIDYPMESLKLIEHPILQTESADEIDAKYEQLQVIFFFRSIPILVSLGPGRHFFPNI